MSLTENESTSHLIVCLKVSLFMLVETGCRLAEAQAGVCVTVTKWVVTFCRVGMP